MRTPQVVPFLLLSACGSLPRAPGTIVRDPHSFAEPNRARVTHVSLELELDFGAREARGTVVLQVERPEPAAPLVLDTHALVIDEVTGGDGTPRRFHLGPEVERFGEPLVIELASGDREVRVRYRTTERSEALQWLSPAQTADGTDPFLFTQGQSILTRSWIPLQDSPGVRVSYDARVHCSDGLTAVMSAERLGRDAQGAWRFRLDQPVPPYLIALACGKLAFRPLSERCGVFAEPSVAEGAAYELADTERMVQAAEALFGPYRWGRYDLIVLPPSFPFGGMENPTLTFATPTILAGDRSLVALVAHELAHSWSGNLVTNATWSDFWLNEGFTVYCENRIMEVLYGAERAATERLLAIAELERELQTLDPWQQILRMPLGSRHPDDGFSGVPYTKGALFLSCLEAAAGRERFDAFLRGYFARHAFQSITTQDFLDDLARELPDAAAAVDVARWTEQPGLPSDAPRPESRSLAAVDAELARLAAGTPPSELVTASFTTQQWLRFLRGLPETTTADDMVALDEAFGFTSRGNSEVLCQWLELAIQHGYAPADARLEEFLRDVGRRKFLKPLYMALVQASPERARALYAQNRERYHSVVTTTLDGIVGR